MSERKNFTGSFQKGQAITAFYFGLPGIGHAIADKQNSWPVLSVWVVTKIYLSRIFSST
jgi:hypothetical protein